MIRRRRHAATAPEAVRPPAAGSSAEMREPQSPAGLGRSAATSPNITQLTPTNVSNRGNKV